MTDKLRDAAQLAEREAFERALAAKPDARFWNAADAMFWAWQARAALEQQDAQQDVDWEKLYRLEVKKKEFLVAKYERDIKPLTKIVPLAQTAQQDAQTNHCPTCKRTDGDMCDWCPSMQQDDTASPCLGSPGECNFNGACMYACGSASPAVYQDAQAVAQPIGYARPFDLEALQNPVNPTVLLVVARDAFGFCSVPIYAAPTPPAQQSDERLLRLLLAVRVAGAHLYADDGEMSDCSEQPHIDFKRDSVKDIERKLIERGMRKAWGSIAEFVAPTPPAQEKQS